MTSASRAALDRDLSGYGIRLQHSHFGTIVQIVSRPLSGRRRRGGAPAQHLLDGRHRLGQRLDAELSAQELLESLVFDHRRATTALPQQAADDRHPRRLAVLVEVDGAAERGDRRLVVAGRGAQLPVLDRDGLDPVADPPLRLLGPGVVDALERRALAQQGGAGQRLGFRR
jgi:hypothetical protein